MKPSSDKFVSHIWLQALDKTINLRGLVDSPAVYNSLSSAGEIRKNVGKLVAIESMGEKLDSKLCIQMFVRLPNEREVPFEEIKTFADGNCW